MDTLTIVGLVTDRAKLIVYDDDGETTGYQDGEYATLRIVMKDVEGNYDISCEKDEHGGFCSPVKTLHCELYNAQNEVFHKTIML